MMKIAHIGYGPYLEEGEEVVRIFRRPFRLIPFLLELLLWGGLIYIVAWSQMFRMDFLWIYAGIGAVGFFRLWRRFMDWWKNAILMTTESLLFLTWENFFKSSIARLDYFDQDVIDIQRNNAWAYFGHHGDLIFSKISGAEPHVFEKVWRPNRAVKILTAHREKMLDEKNFTEEGALKDLLSQLVQTHVRKNGQPDRVLGERESDEPQVQMDELLNKEVVREREVIDIKKEVILADGEVLEEEVIIEVEKELDDEGGIEIQI